MAITENQKEDFHLLFEFARKPGNRNLALVETKDLNGNPVTVVCAVVHEEGGSVLMTPIARLFSGDPYDELEKPEGAEMIDMTATQAANMH